MTTRTTRIEVQAESDGGWSVARNRIIDAYFVDLEAANDYACSCANRAQRAGMAVSLHILPMDPPSNAAA